MAITKISAPRTVTPGNPLDFPAGDDGQFHRFDLASASANNYKRLLAVLNCSSLDPFNAESWLSKSRIQGLSILMARDIRVGGDSMMYCDNDVFVPDEEMPGYLADILKLPRHAQMIEHLASGDTHAVYERGFVISHPHSFYFGHFLVEIAPKLAIVKRYYDAGHRVPIYLGPEEESYIREFICLAIPEARFITPPKGAAVLIKRCMLPSQSHMYLYNQHHNKFLDDLVHKCASACAGKQFPERILISREKLGPTFRLLDNWAELAEIAEKYGYVKVAPELFPLHEQIAMFGAARHIAGEYGSGLHNAIYSKKDVSVVSFNWINLVQQAIGLSREQPNYFILPEGGIPILSPAIASNGGGGRFAIPPAIFANILENIHG